MRHDEGNLWLRVAVDAAMAILGLFVGYWSRYNLPPFNHSITGGAEPDFVHYLAAAPVLALTVIGVFGLMRVYRVRRGLLFIDELFSLIGAMAVVGLFDLALIGLYRGFSYSRLTFFYWLVWGGILIALARYLFRLRRGRRRLRGLDMDRALVVGSGPASDLLIQRLRMFPDYGYRVEGVLTDDLPAGEKTGGVEVLAGIEALVEMVQGGEIDVVFFALSSVSQERILELIDECRRSEVEFRLLPGMLELMTSRVSAEHIDGIPILLFRHGLDMEGSATGLKRAFDLVGASLGLIVTSPFLLLIALLVKLTSPGPVILHQERVGMHGRTFQMHKFRSMRVNAEIESGPVWATTADPRRTPIGRVLRRLSLDELPQLWNIVRGDMSLVGPRAERPTFVREFSLRWPRYADRQLVRPGLAGWAQANDLRGQTPVEERLIYDLYYIENWSLAFDLKILLITVARVWTHKNAY